MVSTRLPPGFRFHPTDVELVLYYLKRKIMGKKLHYEAIADVNIYKCSPWDLPDKSSLKSKDLEWFFFCPREKKYTTGSRVKRATENGYWKTTGKERTISSSDKTVGAVKTLVFHLGQAPRGERTDWVIHEYRILDNKLAEAGIQDSYVLCKVFKKNGPGPKASAQYGAPFNEADWANDDDDDDDVAHNNAISFFAEGPSQSVQMQNEGQSLPPGSGLFHSGNGLLAVAPTSTVAADDTNDEIASFLASFADEDMLLHNENGLNQDDLNCNEKKKLLPSTEGLDIYNGLHDLGSWAALNEGIYDSTGAQDVVCPFNLLPEDNSTYLELDDLLLPLDCTDGVSGTHFSSPYQAYASYVHETMQQLPSHCQASASDGHENMQRLPSVTNLAGMDEHSLFANELVVLPNTSESHKSLDVVQMMDHYFYQENASYNLGFPFQQLENGVCSPQTMERGSYLENRISRFMECVPAHLPSAAAELLALCSCGGSSIHIKAEVTHGAGECTKEALAVMMEGSSSCWCNLDFGKILLLVVKGLLNFIEVISDLILVCCLNTVSTNIHDYYLNENLSVSSPSPKLVDWLNMSSLAIMSNALYRIYVLSLFWLPLSTRLEFAV